MRIYLIGFMGTGKTTLGTRVARDMDVPFLDTDRMIEKSLGMSINDIFSTLGEDEFRLLESRAIRETKDINKALVATGGGLPVYHNNMPWLIEHGVTMYLEWPEDILLASLVHHRSLRPLLTGLSEEEAIQKAMQLLSERKPVYEQAAMTLEMSGEMEGDIRILERACKYIW